MTDETLDLSTISMEQLEALSIDDLLSNNIGDYSLSSNLPDGIFFGYIEKVDVRRLAARVEDGKKGQLQLNLMINVVQAHTLADPSEDKSSFVGRKHFESYNLLTDFGVSNLIKLLLGIVGVSYKDKKAIAELNQNPKELLDELVNNHVVFGFTIKNTERNGFENCNVVLKEKNFIDMNRALEIVG